MVPNQKVILPLLEEKEVNLYIKREDMLHPHVSGNKYRKLKYNLIEAEKLGCSNLLTFGGAFSNHIAATAFAGNKAGFKTIGVIRGEELQNSWKQNPTLKLAHEMGMKFHFISRSTFRLKESDSFLKELRDTFGDFYLLPEGGTNPPAIKGCEEILVEADSNFDHICCSVGAGGTIAGIINSSKPEQSILGFPSLKGNFLKQDIRKFARKDNWDLITDYHFGGYAKVDAELVDFINDFKSKTNIPLDPIYTGKMLFGILDLVKKGFFKPNTRILAIHTGGLQGIKGMNLVLKKKELPILDL